MLYSLNACLRRSFSEICTKFVAHLLSDPTRNRIRPDTRLQIKDIKISTSTQPHEILYTNSKDMLVLLFAVASRFYKCCTAPVPEIMDIRLKRTGRNAHFDKFACTLFASMHIKSPWPASASKLYRPSDRRLSKLVPTFADRGCRVVKRNGSLRPYSRFSRRDLLCL
jgi:hypothetical protein